MIKIIGICCIGCVVALGCGEGFFVVFCFSIWMLRICVWGFLGSIDEGVIFICRGWLWVDCGL